MFPRKIDTDQAHFDCDWSDGHVGSPAYAGLIFQCAPQPGETVVVSAASGGVGQMVAQLGRLSAVGWWHCRVYEKLAYLQELGVDAGIPSL